MVKQEEINYIKKHIKVNNKDAEEIWNNCQIIMKEQKISFKKSVKDLKGLINIVKREGKFKKT